MLEKVRGEGVPQDVGRQPGTDPGLPAVALDELPEALPGHRGPARREKQVGRAPPVEWRPGDLDVPREPARGRLSERDQAILPSLSGDTEDAVLHVYALARQRHDFGDPQARGIHELEHRAVAQAQRRAGIGGLQERLDLVLSETLRQGKTDARVREIDGRVLGEPQVRRRERIEAPHGRERARGRA